MKRQVTASAPGKLLLFGEHAVVYGHPCIVTAVDQRLYVTVKKNGVDAFHLEAPDLGLSAYSKTIQDLGGEGLPKGVRFVEMLYKRFLEQHPQKEGIDVVTKSDFSSSFGFGSSSAVTVAFARALTELYGLELSDKELFELCYRAVLDVQGLGSGFDIAAAIWGGTIYYVPPAKTVRKLESNGMPLVVGYTGVKADTPTLVRMVRGLKESQPEKTKDLFDQMAKLVEVADDEIEAGDWEVVGALMDKDQDLLRQLQVSSMELEDLIGGAKTAGAAGAKLSGAGGGDCMVAVVPNGHREGVEREIEKRGGEVMRVALNARGVRLER